MWRSALRLRILGKAALPAIVVIVGQALAVTLNGRPWALWADVACTALGVVWLAWLLAGHVCRPLTELGTVMGRLIDNDLSATVGHTDRRDEIGRIAHYVEAFKRNALGRHQKDAHDAAEVLAREERRHGVERLTSEFDATAQGALDEVSTAATQLNSIAQEMAATARAASEQATTGAQASKKLSASVETAAAAAEELSNSIAEIGQQVSRSSDVSGSVADEARRTRGIIDALAEKATRIDEVISLIQNVASQTNLLALNATIEAARAGEAGKGFAVVANEVKNLASQTEKATGVISSHIAEVQSATRDAVGSIGGIVGRIEEISEIASAIASSVTEQSSATAEIARNVQEAANGTGRVAAIIDEVTRAAARTGETAGQVLTSAQLLNRQSTSLKTVVGTFLADVGRISGSEQRTFRCADVHPADYPTVAAARHLGRILSEHTQNRFTVEVFPNGALCTEKNAIEQVKVGGLDIVRVSSGTFHDLVPEVMVLSLPFLYRDVDHLRKVIYGPIGDKVLARCEAAGYIGLALLESGPRSMYGKKPLRRPTDLKGLRLRVIASELWAELARAMGATPTPIPHPAIANALLTNQIDAAENNYATYESGRHYEGAPFYCETQHVMCPEILVFSKKIWDTLDEPAQAALRGAVKEMIPAYVKLWEEKEAAARKALVNAGVTFVTDIARDEFRKVVQPVWTKFANTPDLKRLAEEIAATR
jgi:tripartite ATP-independent transporter DctP family solute receptor